MASLLPFEKKILSGLASCGITADSISEKNPLGVAVSGGADSVSLLISLKSIFGNSSVTVVTVNHGIRDSFESDGDEQFVLDLCKKLKVTCKVYKVPHGKIIDYAKSQKKSVEETARDFRYNFFENFIEEENLSSLCLAHNLNDKIETILMRFLQGGATESISGIPLTRNKICRPMLGISREEIESYLMSKNQEWRTDSTNSDTKYFRNRIRNILIPVLNENFSGWQKALISGSKKSSSDEEYFDNLCSQFFKENKDSILKNKQINRKTFYELPEALRRRVFFSILNLLGFGGRFPFKIYEKISSWEKIENRTVFFNDLKISLDAKNLVFSSKTYVNISLSNRLNNFIETGFSFLFGKTSDSVKIGSVLFSFQKDENQKSDLMLEVNWEENSVLIPVRLPFLLRSFVPGDKIKTSSGKYKSVAQVFSDWKIPAELREKIFIIDELPLKNSKDSELRGIIASPFGFKNWIVDFDNI